MWTWYYLLNKWFYFISGYFINDLWCTLVRISKHACKLKSWIGQPRQQCNIYRNWFSPSAALSLQAFKSAISSSLLHLFHHGIMPLSCWPGARWFCGGHASFMSMLNSFVHVIMYTYYMISAMGPEYKVPLGAIHLWRPHWGGEGGVRELADFVDEQYW